MKIVEKYDTFDAPYLHASFFVIKYFFFKKEIILSQKHINSTIKDLIDELICLSKYALRFLLLVEKCEKQI